MSINVSAYLCKLVESDLGRVLTGGEPEHKPGTDGFRLASSVEVVDLRPSTCFCLRCRTIRAVRYSKKPRLLDEHAEVLRATIVALKEGGYL